MNISNRKASSIRPGRGLVGRCATGAALLLAAALIACSGAWKEPGIRIVLITLDTLRFDSLLGVDGDPGDMPRTAEFAKRGQIFHRFFSSSSATQPAHASLFTGLHPWEHGVLRNGNVLDDDFRTIAERLEEEGFETAAVVSSFPLHPLFGFEQGFNFFDHQFDLDLAGPTWQGTQVQGGRFYRLADRVTEHALRLLEEAKTPRQFFWFHYFDPHEPYGDTDGGGMRLIELYDLARRGDPGLDKKLRTARARYDRDVQELDTHLGRIFSRLQEDGGTWETHVFVVSDHGESFGESRALGHGSRVTREQVQVPLFIVSPDLAPGNREDVAGSVDVTAAILSLAGVSTEALPGRDLTRPSDGQESLAFGMRSTEPGPFGDPRKETRLRFFLARGSALYAGDSERIIEEDDENRVVGDDTVSAPIRNLFKTFETAMRDVTVHERVDEKTLEALRALGYVRD